jgi:hypothetical protein
MTRRAAAIDLIPGLATANPSDKLVLHFAENEYRDGPTGQPNHFGVSP